ncbi:hypothetical protein CHS0354_010687 [Potamilus streckersoni]|uniref:Secreted protein n=1 Tax=Potamilus streckersoni TaxID=2493646 RepID=A0AAE0WAP4_9BIVA|nr:hypothetical protein CHS0354_010687 [Potamilus streckersoni]
MKILAMLLVTLCTRRLASQHFLIPEMNNIVVLPETDGTLYEFYPEVPPLPDWLWLYPYQRYPTTKHRSKRQTDWGAEAKLTIPLGGGSSKPSWSFSGIVTHSEPNFNAQINAGLQGTFGKAPDLSVGGHINGTG